MKKKNQYIYNSRKNKRNKNKLAFPLIIVGVILLGSTIWVGVNGWNIEDSLKVFSTSKNDDTDEKKLDSDVSDEDKSNVDGNETSEQENSVNENTNDPEEINNSKDEEDNIDEQPSTDDEKENGSIDENSSPSIDSGGYMEGQKLPTEPTIVNGILVANKKYPLPSTYAPGESKEARAAFDEMAAEANLSGFNLTAFSTYRSFEYQTSLYDRYVSRDGRKAADRYSARPGYSEHQTGLAFDIGEVNFEKQWATAAFGETEAGKWLAANAHRYGFILRYPEGKESITGYMHESWHFRYLGFEVADEIFKRNITLEEYLEID